MTSGPPPFSYEQGNVGSALVSPSTTHVADTVLARFFQRYLFNKVRAVFEWTLPDTWPKNYFEAVLYSWGWLAVVNTDKFGVICQGCGLRGYDLYYQPTHAVVTNPLLNGILQPKIGVQCELIRMSPDYRGVWDLVIYYGNLLALTWQSLQMNLVNSKLAFAFFTRNKAGAESLKKMYDQVMEGNPAVVVDSKLLDDSGEIPWKMFVQNLSQNHIAPNLLEELKTIEAAFYQEIGITNVNLEKRERLLTDEINANNQATKANAEIWLESMQDCCERVNSMFGLSLSVKFREEVGASAVERLGKSVESVPVRPDGIG